MLSLLHIENIAVIEQADIEFLPGFTVLTGETGAGKSMIIDSIGAIMGQRTSKELIRNGAKKGFVSAVFDDITQELRDQIAELGLEGDDPASVHIQRELNTSGRSVCRVNMKPVSASVLRQLSPYLINIHGQHDGQKLMQDEYHIEFLDRFCGAEEQLKQFQPIYNELFQLRRQIRELDHSEQERAQRIDMLRYQFDEIAAAELQPGEEEQLRERKQFFDNSGKLAGALQSANSALSGSDGEGACSMIGRASEAMAEVSSFSEEMGALYQRAQELSYQAEDLAAAVSALALNIDFSEAEQLAIEDRLDVIYRLEHKYGATVNDVLDYCDKAASELDVLENAEDHKEKLIAEYREMLGQAREIADGLSRHRRAAAKVLEKKIVEQLADLNMEKVKLNVAVNPQTKLNTSGMDTVQFLISTNPGEPVKPLTKIASGGELSRIMLAIKNVLAGAEDVGTWIFDEIDTGVSGRAAQKIAQKLSSISRQKQTLCVTHLPQIAAMGDQHFLIRKNICADRTFTSVEPVEGEDRMNELARMISGAEVTEASLRNAEDLLRQAEKWKKTN